MSVLPSDEQTKKYTTTSGYLSCRGRIREFGDTPSGKSSDDTRTDLAPDLCLKIITSQDCFPTISGQPVNYDRFAMLRIPQLMDEPSKSNVDELFGAKEFFKEHGLFYTENAAVGGIIASNSSAAA
ncbi:hypothetical protein CCUS01_16243 [Colletotrichum cuscutae]|uniref:Uncharacterized protein n=1 Tax=Colletotrichum cuscutae TaxID=1209917 RepID=A0AAI9VBJ1_9PEZI|nr:hypothetical protein CCUS01_16243 [Colletotrichum cuscutae]